MSDKQKAFLSIFLNSLLSGAVGAITKIGLLKIPPLSFAFLRFLLASISLMPFIFLSKRNVFKNLIALTPLSLLATANIVLFILGIKTTTATIGGMLYGGVPLLTGLMARFFASERLSAKKTLGIIVGFIGVSILVLLPVLEQGKEFSGDLKGNILIGIGVVCWSFYMVFSQKAQKKHSPFILTSIFILVTAIVLFPFFLLELRTNYGWWNNVDLAGMTSIIYVALFATIGSYLLHQYAIKHGGSVFASMIFYLTPVFTFLAAFLLLGERLTSGLLFGAVLALLGIFLST